MRVNPMDIVCLVIGILIGFVILWLAIDYLRMVRRHWKWEIDEETD